MSESHCQASRETVAAFPRLLPGSTVIAAEQVVHLIAGEDFRFTIQTGDATEVIARVLRGCQGIRPLEDLLAGLNPAEQELAIRIVERLRSERMLFDGPALPPPETPWRIEIEGTGVLAQRARGLWPSPAGTICHPLGGSTTPNNPNPAGVSLVRVLVQQDLDLAQVLEFNRRQLAGEADAWLWVTTGPLARGYVSPVILKRGRPCLECLLRHFRRLSPAPQLYDALERPGEPTQFVPGEPAEPLARIVLEIAGWKLRRLGQAPAAASQFALHVVEAETLETALHPVWLDPTCPGCGDG
ncbi:MAG: TOMM precursor leader peptide-binding protein [Planctomycetaceae bacterium]